MNEMEWLKLLLTELQAQSRRVKKLRKYANNEPKLPEMGENLKRAWKQFQIEARTNWAGMIIDPLVERVVPNAIVVENDAEAEIVARRIWRDNHMDALFTDFVTDAFITSVGYLMVTASDVDGNAVITVEDPEMVVTIPDVLHPWKQVAGIKVWRDTLGEADHAYVWHDGVRAHWTRARAQAGRRWSSLDIPSLKKTPPTSWQFDEYETISEELPLKRFDNWNHVGEFEQHIPVIDRINRELLNRLVISSMQAYRQRALRADPQTGGLPELDDNGNKIDYSGIFEPAPGALWELPPGIDIWESAQTDVRQLLEAEKEDIRQLSASTKTPIAVLMPDNANQSAEGARFANEGIVSKARDRIKRLKPIIESVMVKALQVEGVNLSSTLAVEFEPPQMVTMAEKYDAAVKAKSIGESLESIQRNILGYSQTQIDKDAQQRAHEAITLQLTMPQAQQTASGAA